jgi:hypothetical protein
MIVSYCDVRELRSHYIVSKALHVNISTRVTVVFVLSMLRLVLVVVVVVGVEL